MQPSNQVSEKSLRFIEDYGLEERVVFAQDPDSAAIDALGIRKSDAMPMEEGVPHPTTLLLDRRGVIRFVDVRENFHVWLAPSVVAQAPDDIGEPARRAE